MIPWFWLITSGALFVGSGRLVQFLVSEGEERRRAAVSLGGLALGYLLFKVLMV